MRDLSILIPARNEEWLSKTVEDILNNIEADTEVIICLDGVWANPPLEDHERVTILYVPESIGQRAGQNRCARMSTAKYVMKVDAHCAFDKGFDRKMIEAFNKFERNGETHITMVPVMRNLHVFDWKCKKCGGTWYMGPASSRCENKLGPDGTRLECDGTEFERVLVWQPRPKRHNTSFRFNRELEFKYFKEWKGRHKGRLTETMSLQGSCFMARRENYWKYELCDESWGSWGGQGAEVAIKTWLSGGRVIANKNTWYAHMFRTQAGFSHPYPNPGAEQQRAKNMLREIFLNDTWPKAVHKLEWLVERFKPVPDWHDMT